MPALVQPRHSPSHSCMGCSQAWGSLGTAYPLMPRLQPGLRRPGFRTSPRLTWFRRGTGVFQQVVSLVQPGRSPSCSLLVTAVCCGALGSTVCGAAQRCDWAGVLQCGTFPGKARLSMHYHGAGALVRWCALAASRGCAISEVDISYYSMMSRLSELPWSPSPGLSSGEGIVPCL